MPSRQEGDADNLEYYTAKQSVNRAPGKKQQDVQNSASKEKSSGDYKVVRSTPDGYVQTAEPTEKKREFERYKERTFAQKASEKAKQNPLIPIGMLATVVALTMGLRAVSRGDKWQSQMMMRARIGAQGFTILAVLASIMYAGQTQSSLPAPSTNTRRPPSPDSPASSS